MYTDQEAGDWFGKAVAIDPVKVAVAMKKMYSDVANALIKATGDEGIDIAFKAADEYVATIEEVLVSAGL